MLTKRKKAWFFPLCGEQPKINELIFLFFLTSRLIFFLSPEVCHQSEGPVNPALYRLLTKRKKAWFFPLCDYQPKINELIFLFFLTSCLIFLLSSEGCHQSEGPVNPALYRLLTKRKKAWFFPLCDYQPKINELIFLFFLTSRLIFFLSSEGCHQSEGSVNPALFTSGHKYVIPVSCFSFQR
ncbi:hypothetical protein F3J28_09505 [Enterobacter sp. Ap-1006]|nr:hypothetical protein [Enterobacter sp. Ap-1006]